MGKANFLACQHNQYSVYSPHNWYRGVAQSGSAPGLGPGGRRFESSRPDQFFPKSTILLLRLLNLVGLFKMANWVIAAF